MPGRPHLSTRSPRRPPSLGTAGVVVLTALLAGCGAVHVRETDASGTERRACRSLVEDLPHRVAGHARRETSGSSLGAAWGDPAIVLRCGVGTPADYQPASPCQRVNGVDWYVPEDVITDQGKDVVLTTVGRKPGVEVVVPAEDRPPDAVMVDLADTIRRRTTVAGRCE
jgi:hypothetical protein